MASKEAWVYDNRRGIQKVRIHALDPRGLHNRVARQTAPTSPTLPIPKDLARPLPPPIPAQNREPSFPRFKSGRTVRWTHTRPPAQAKETEQPQNNERRRRENRN